MYRARFCSCRTWHRTACVCSASCFRGFGIEAVVMETYKGVNLGKEFTSGKGVFSLSGHPGGHSPIICGTNESGSGVLSLPDATCTFCRKPTVRAASASTTSCRNSSWIVSTSSRTFPSVTFPPGNAYATGSIMPADRAPAFQKLSYLCVIICRCSGSHRMAGPPVRTASRVDGCVSGRGTEGTEVHHRIGRGRPRFQQTLQD